MNMVFARQAARKIYEAANKYVWILKRNYASFSRLVRISINFMLIKQGSFEGAE